MEAGLESPGGVLAAKGRDGKTDMWGLIARPTNFDLNKKYPVIEYIYQGPGDQYVPRLSVLMTEYDFFELGFIVVMVDGMGTSFRSRAFENVCYKNLKDAGLPGPYCLDWLWLRNGNILIWMWTGRYLRLFCRWSGIYEMQFCFILISIKRLIRLVVVMITVWIRFGGMNLVGPSGREINSEGRV